LRDRFNAEATALSVSSIVVYELLVGAEKSAKPVEIRQEVERFLSRGRSASIR
jgi:tRNA(fMet)-specific endonuclease VapC